MLRRRNKDISGLQDEEADSFVEELRTRGHIFIWQESEVGWFLKYKYMPMYREEAIRSPKFSCAFTGDTKFCFYISPYISRDLVLRLYIFGENDRILWRDVKVSLSHLRHKPYVPVSACLDEIRCRHKGVDEPETTNVLRWYTKVVSYDFKDHPTYLFYGKGETLFSAFCHFSFPNHGREDQDKEKFELALDFSTLFYSKRFSDVTVRVEGRDIQVHKAILSCRSPVFAAMFDHEMLEKERSVVVIEDFSYEVIDELLHYIYTGVLTPIHDDKVTLELYSAADKYLLTSLKENCSEVLSNKMTADTAIDALIIADTHDDHVLRQAAIQRILMEANHTMKTQKWIELLKNYPLLANSVFLNTVTAKKY